MSLQDIVNVTITATTQTPSREGFGVPLIAAVHNHFTGTRSYTSLQGITSDGFITSDAAYLTAQAVFSQSPRVDRVKIGKRTSSGTTDLATDLNTLRAADADWYGLLLDSNTAAEVEAAAAWVEANNVLYAAQSNDTAVLDPASTTDVGAVLHAAGYARTSLWYHPTAGQYIAAAILGNRLPDDPGSDSWAYKTLAGVASYTLTDTQRAAALAKNVNIYTPVAGVAVTEQGTSSSGEYTDITRFVDWLRARIREDVFGVLINNRKLPYTDGSVRIVQAAILAVLNEGVRVNGLESNPAPWVTAPKVADVSQVDRAARRLPNVNFGARLAGAIHTLTISGTVTV